jgi:FlaA1/EpsC-like NDP-sugar epimerase
VLCLDLLMAAVSFTISCVVGTGLFVYKLDLMFLSFPEQAAILLILQFVSFCIFRTYSGVLRFSTFIDTIKVLSSVVLTSVIALAVNQATMHLLDTKLFVNSTIVLYMGISFVLLFCLRVGAKTAFELIAHKLFNRKRIYIYDNESKATAIAKMIRSDIYSQYQVAGLIDDSQQTANHDVAGMHVLHFDDKLFSRLQRDNIEGIILSESKKRELKHTNRLAQFVEHGLSVYTTAGFEEWEADDDRQQAFRMGKINSIKIEDLLERPTINIDTENVRQTIQDKTVMVTGAAGSIGSELVRQIIPYGPKAVILFEIAESPLHDLTLDLKSQFPHQTIVSCIGDVRNRRRIEQVMAEYKPDVVYHAAAYKHVPLMESHPDEAVITNVLGSKNMADLAVEYGVQRFVMISTDKAVNPTNVMGCSKRLAEIYVQSLAKTQHTTKFVTTRFGNVLGSNGSVIPYFKKQIAAGGPVTVTHPDIIRYFMTIPEACTLVMEASTLGRGGEIFVFDMGQPVKILDLAKNMIRLAGFVPGEDIAIEFTGLRPGEKLYEELLNQKETTLPTQNEKILVAKVREYEYTQVEKDISQLIELAREGKPFITVKKMKEIVPEFKSKNSAFEMLDK